MIAAQDTSATSVEDPTERSPRSYLLPPGRIARRAREWRVYDQAGDRYVDFWQADGGAFLGHRPRGLGRTVSAEIDRGLWTAVPTPWAERLSRSLQRLARRAGAATLTPINGTPPARRALADRWLPLAEDQTADMAERLDHPAPRPPLTVVLPAPGVFIPPHVASPGGTSVPSGLSDPSGAHALSPNAGHRSTPCDFRSLSPVTAAALTRAADLLAMYLESSASVERLTLASRLPVPPGWRRRGVWLLPPAGGPPPERRPGTHSPAPSWHDFRRRAAHHGVLLPPDPWTPIVIPGELGRKEEAAWKGLIDDWPH